MPVNEIPVNINGIGRRVGIVLSRFNPGIGDVMLAGALRALKEAGVADRNITVATVPARWRRRSHCSGWRSPALSRRWSRWAR